MLIFIHFSKLMCTPGLTSLLLFHLSISVTDMFKVLTVLVNGINVCLKPVFSIPFYMNKVELKTTVTYLEKQQL